MNKKHNSKIFRVNEDKTFYPYIITSSLKKLPITFNNYHNELYYIKNSKIIGKIIDEKISRKIDDDYERLMIWQE